MAKQYCVYILANLSNTVTYTGVTSDLLRRIYQHKTGSVDGFTKRYRVTRLVYYEMYEDATTAIAREKQIKGGSRLDKTKLVKKANKGWKDLYDEL